MRSAVAAGQTSTFDHLDRTRLQVCTERGLPKAAATVAAAERPARNPAVAAAAAAWQCNKTRVQHAAVQHAAPCSRRGAVAGVLAAAALLLNSSGAAANVPQTSAAGENVGFLTNAEIDKKRKKANFRRAHDGHVAILNKYTKTWTDVKCDLQVPGLLLLREVTGQVYYLGYAGLKQVDLSDDQVVAAVAADNWENNMRLVHAEAEDGTMEALEMTREGFYQLVSLASDEDWAEPLAADGKAAASAKQSDKRQ